MNLFHILLPMMNVILINIVVVKKLISKDDELIYRQYDSESDESDDEKDYEEYR